MTFQDISYLCVVVVKLSSVMGSLHWMFLAAAALFCLQLQFASAQSQGVQLIFEGSEIVNHSTVQRGHRNASFVLGCVTPSENCCAMAGQWFFPNETVVPNVSAEWSFYSSRTTTILDLHRRRGHGGVSGIYHCRIPDARGNDQDLYVGIYTAITGNPNITTIWFELKSPLNAESPTFTLTCVSEEGPVTSVVWRRGSDQLQNSISSSEVVDTESATYHHNLTVTGRLPGMYQCRVFAVRNNESPTLADIERFSVSVAASPTMVSAEQVSDSNTIRVSWTAGSGRAPVTGYQIYYQTKGDRGSVNAEHNVTEIVITGLQFSFSYSITMVALSEHLPSQLSNSETVRIAGIPQPIIHNAEQVDDTNTIYIHWTVNYAQNAALTGYKIFYQTEGDQGCVDVGSNVTETVITGLQFVQTYTITVVASSLIDPPSEPSNPEMVRIEVPHVQLFYKHQVVPSHSIVLQGLFGNDITLLCLTDKMDCCSTAETGGSAAGNWTFPNGTEVPPEEMGWSFYQTHGPQVVHLHRRRRGRAPGIFHCRIPDASGNEQDQYIGIYTATTGMPTITEDIQFELIDGQIPQFTLTCISEGGPVNHVTWSRDGDIIQGDNATYVSQSRVLDTESATYHHTLTVTGRIPGNYQCQIGNNRSQPFHVSDDETSDGSQPTSPTSHTPTSTDETPDGSQPTSPTSHTPTSTDETPDGNKPTSPSSHTPTSTDETPDGSQPTSPTSHTPTSTDETPDGSQPTSPTSHTPIFTSPSPSPEGGTNNHTQSSDGDVGGKGSASIAAVAGGAVSGILVLLSVAVVVIIIIVLLRHHSSKELKQGIVVHYDHANEHMYTTVSNSVSSTAPDIKEFPKDSYVKEGESVSFKVVVDGTPTPTLTWYLNDVEVVADYSTEVGEDGSVTIPSVEPRHAGVYRLVATNDAGTVSREVTVAVLDEDEPHPLATKIEIRPIVVEEFGEHVKSNHENNNYEFKNEFQSLDTCGQHPVTVGVSPKNRQKNRFVNITVYDDNQVVLKPIMEREDCQDSYINASYVDGYSFPNKFIATQAPLPTTVVDFWRLVWQEKSQSIVMVTNIKEGNQTKCKQYWPDSGSQHYGPFTVTITGQQILANYTTRTFQVKLSGSSERPLKVTQFHFTAWPDHGVPAYASSTLEFHRKANSHWESTKGPMLIHCSAGVGRTGTFIAINHVLEQVEKEGVVDIAGTINKIRQQRMKLVQTPEQYTFIHDAILEAITCGDTQIPSSEFSTVLKKMKNDPQSGKTGLEVQFHVLEQVSPKPDQVLREVAFKFPHKNRSMDNVPPDLWRIVLKGEYPGYIHATCINGYQQRKAFIIAEGPMESTCRDFWKMVYDQKCGAIVMLSDLTEGEEEVCYQYWPVEGSLDYGEMQVDALSTEQREGYFVKNFTVMPLQSETEAYPVVQFHVTNWNADGKCSYINTIIDVIEEVAKVQRKTGNHPVVVHCSDTVSRSGMFCAIATAIERCKVEGVVDVFQVVKALRTSKPGAVPTVEQYQFIFDVVLLYLDSFNTYANFK